MSASLWSFLKRTQTPADEERSTHSDSTDLGSSSNTFGYGKNPRCSPLQQQWQIAHPTFKDIQIHPNIKVKYRDRQQEVYTLADPALLLPLASPSLFKVEPRLIDYVQLPLYLWIPDWFLPHLVPWVPCPVDGCPAPTTRRRWRSGGPRVIHGVGHAMYLHGWDYNCTVHKSTAFAAWDPRCLQKMNIAARDVFTSQFILTPDEGVTRELFDRIVHSRRSGSSLHALRRELVRFRYERLYRTITQYYNHCEQHLLSKSTPFQKLVPGFGMPSNTYAPLIPDLHHADREAYWDHDPLDIKSMSKVYSTYCHNQASLWKAHTQQLTADRVSIDATYKIAKKIRDSNVSRCWSMVDTDTGVILHSQLLTHETHQDVLPMFKQYALRCAELKVPLPSRICTDRARMDVRLIQHPDAFPNTHINQDVWHFVELFGKTLNKQSRVWRDAKTAFSKSMYSSVQGADGSVHRSHAEPDTIMASVAHLISLYSLASDGAPPAVTDDTKKWWKDQKKDIEEHRLLSNPSKTSDTAPISSSPQENMHRQPQQIASPSQSHRRDRSSFSITVHFHMEL